MRVCARSRICINPKSLTKFFRLPPPLTWTSNDAAAAAMPLGPTYQRFAERHGAQTNVGDTKARLAQVGVLAFCFVGDGRHFVKELVTTSKNPCLFPDRIGLAVPSECTCELAVLNEHAGKPCSLYTADRRWSART